MAVLLGVWALCWFVGFARGGGMAWHYFMTGDGALGRVHDPVQGGLHLYAGLPYLQIGPIALAASFLLQHLTPDGGLMAGQLVGVAAGACIVLLTRSIARQAQPTRPARELDRMVIIASAFFTPVWMYVAVRSDHLDDVLALLFGVVAVKLVLDGRAAWAGIAVGLAIDAKPWAIPFACVLLLLPTIRSRFQAAVAAAAVVLVAWLPFVLGDPRTLPALDRFTIPNRATSVLRLLGVTARTPPWDRPAQLALGVLLAVLVIRNGRWAGIILVVVAARLVLDPGVNRYYTAGAAVGALLWDLAGSKERFPWWSAVTCVALFASRFHHLPTRVHASLTLGYFIAAVVLLALRPAAPETQQAAELADSSVS
jgi:hypothetical protein